MAIRGGTPLIIAVYRHQVDACADAGPALPAADPTPRAALERRGNLFVDFLATKHGLAAAHCGPTVPVSRHGTPTSSTASCPCALGHSTPLPPPARSARTSMPISSCVASGTSASTPPAAPRTTTRADWSGFWTRGCAGPVDLTVTKDIASIRDDARPTCGKKRLPPDGQSPARDSAVAQRRAVETCGLPRATCAASLTGSTGSRPPCRARRAPGPEPGRRGRALAGGTHDRAWCGQRTAMEAVGVLGTPRTWSGRRVPIATRCSRGGHALAAPSGTVQPVGSGHCRRNWWCASRPETRRCRTGPRHSLPAGDGVDDTGG